VQEAEKSQIPSNVDWERRHFELAADAFRERYADERQRRDRMMRFGRIITHVSARALDSGHQGEREPVSRLPFSFSKWRSAEAHVAILNLRGPGATRHEFSKRTRRSPLKGKRWSCLPLACCRLAGASGEWNAP
jgi:hypothetical protein